MAKLTLQQLYLGDKYNIMGKAFRMICKEKPLDEDIRTALELAIVKSAIAATIQMIHEGDFISELQSEMKSLSLCLGVKIDEHHP